MSEKMREILFRGKRVGDYDWAYGCYYKQTAFYGDPVEVHNIITSQEDLEYDMAMEYTSVVPETVGQFTGLTDKNGKKIFEGDILEFRRGRTHAVKFEDGAYIFTGTAIPVRYADKFKVIGNIHDNPELLKEAPNV